jgi:hypothetical protein
MCSIEQDKYQALYDSVIKQGNLFETLSLDALRFPKIRPLYGFSAYCKHEAKQRWRIACRIEKKMVSYGVAPFSPDLPVQVVSTPQEAMKLIVDGENVCINLALAINDSVSAKIYYAIGKEFDEACHHFGEFPNLTDGVEKLYRHDRLLKERY